ncbi:DUF4123 domain-containing protein [Pseudomonas sp. PCH199]|uniref:DUF4123 domain-containing protein n=1 Tax=unclassified Pseudomonas TaxID=196821 RepID=UPI000BD9887F|nr:MULTISPECIES: DUF4123 domain-containing protein [unclassified Pseudomonas]MCW8276308.1 DUF4123 domain-containing protein [Pseudomonas sp. PCH199]PAM83693.1 hypothetical protein CES87_12165 [Pseudomonas sp. ERMR1:02]
MQSDFLSPHAWLERQPLQPSEQLFAIFSNASAAEPLKAWRRLTPARIPSPIWIDTAYAEWEAVMPFVGTVAADSEFLRWVATTASGDWGWLAISTASQQVLVEHLCSLTQVLLPNGSTVFFRFWDGRYLLPMLQCAEIDCAQLLPVMGRCLINGQSVEIGSNALKTSKVFPWWEVPDSVLKLLGAEDASTQINNLLQWLSEEQPSVFEAFSENVLRSKVANFLATPDLPPVPKAELLEYLMEELN